MSGGLARGSVGLGDGSGYEKRNWNKVDPPRDKDDLVASWHWRQDRGDNGSSFFVYLAVSKRNSVKCSREYLRE